MKQPDPRSERKRTALMTAVMGIALLFLAVVLSKTAAVQLAAQRFVSGGISILGAVLFFCVGLMLLNDLRKRWKAAKHSQEETTHGL